MEMEINLGFISVLDVCNIYEKLISNDKLLLYAILGHLIQNKEYCF